MDILMYLLKQNVFFEIIIILLFSQCICNKLIQTKDTDIS